MNTWLKTRYLLFIPLFIICAWTCFAPALLLGDSAVGDKQNAAGSVISLVNNGGNANMHNERAGANEVFPATAASSPSATKVLWSDDFESVSTDGWLEEAGAWSLAREGANQVYQQANREGSACSYNSQINCADQIVQIRVKPMGFSDPRGLAAVFARFQDGGNNYSLALRNGDSMEIMKSVGGISVVLASGSCTVTTGAWIVLKFEVIGNTLKGYADGKLIVSTTDAALASGGVALGTWRASAAFDDLFVNIPTQASSATAPTLVPAAVPVTVEVSDTVQSTTAPTRIESIPVEVTHVRRKQTINGDWTFYYYPDSAERNECSAPTFDDSGWPAVSLPHTWSTYETTGQVHPFIRDAAEKDGPYWWYGWGWYRKHLVIGPELRGKKICLEFDGVQKYTKVWFNGVYIGDHRGGYNSFYFDVTDQVKFGQDNVLAVEVSNRRDDNFGGIPPMTAGNFDVYGGIYRDIRVVVKDTLHIPYQGSYKHEGGTFVTTPKVSATSAVVNVKTYVRNDRTAAVNCTVTTIIKDAAGNAVQQMRTTAAIQPGTIQQFDQTGPAIPNPRLWSPDAPYLYRVYTQVSDGSVITDDYESSLGFRWFSWDYRENVLYLNGVRTPFHGLNRHQEYPWLGDAVPKWLHEKEMRQMKYDLGINFMRTAHYPNDPLIYDLADELGIILIEEVPNIKNLNFGPDIQKQNIQEMIRRDRNHPSIIFWCVGNETDHPADPAWARAEDPTRLIFARNCTELASPADLTHENIGLENLLTCTVRGWYNEDIKQTDAQGNQQCGDNERHHTRGVKDGLQGSCAYWLFADHGCDREYLYSPLKHINPKGWVDLYRIPKYFYYLFQANWAPEPMVFIHPHFWRFQYLGQTKPILVDSNCDTVELFVNGVSQGRQSPSAANTRCVTFNVQVRRGAVEAVGTKDGRTVHTKVIMAGDPAQIVLTTKNPEIIADRAGIAIVRADIVDADGVQVYGATNSLTWEVVSGPGKLVGASTYVSQINDNQHMDGTFYIDAPVTNVVRSTTTPGRITVRVSSPGLQAGEVTISSIAPPAKPDIGIKEPALSDVGRELVPTKVPVIDL